MTKTVTRLSAFILAGILAAATFGLYASLASADRGNDRDWGNDGDRTEIEVENEDTRVHNDVSVTANTGGNSADGGDSGQGGGNMPPPRGGLSLIFPGPDGQGGNAGPGGDGGTITTGMATAYGDIYGEVNSNRVVVEGCGCDEEPANPFLRFFHFDKDGKVLKIEVENEDTKVRNELTVRANTGRNSAEGGDSRGGGSQSFNPWTLWFGHHMADRSGGDGGTIVTGPAYADGIISGAVNQNVVRVLRGADTPAPIQI